ncbi:50S ribosomal protein L35ae [Ignicoccus hospitalis]|uniref:Large ribosomal subunit protein eL33 n=1 Tax=Ignicoccus hospitalis (strain KIN4/I / DSM 18386 / JCM 14125) TaxID=453591 RepID=A8ABG8_IGNH4|nr:50S ribosomal protein L35ae [Ignicoccus hospitalis]ABU82270.1 LSU ribosomal protein L35AE [Ignicoccus hospitalis KIN4/I]HIH90811.1 50S ribosomal protein L35ae [Desulfurococcaceae archaeon]
MEVVIVSYRRGSNDQNPHQVLVRFPSYRDAASAVRSKIIYEDEHGNVYVGKVLRPHGKKGVAIAVFKPNLPGQAMGKVAKVER